MAHTQSASKARKPIDPQVQVKKQQVANKRTARAVADLAEHKSPANDDTRRGGIGDAPSPVGENDLA